MYLHGEYEILRTHANPEKADAFATKLRSRFLDDNLGVEVAVASFPADGRTPEALLAGSRRDFRETVDATPMLAGHFEALVQRVAPSAISVLILGETGVGKEVLARMIHERSPRAQEQFVAVNCAAITESLLESELFGHEKGAFTGAAQAKPGLLESASGGTVLLDEVGEMPATLQAKLLRVLEQREVMRVGSLKPRPIDVRFIAATNRDLEELVQQGVFRRDLFFRLNGISIVIPPLRERVAEIKPLAMAFVEEALRQAGRRDGLTIDSEALDFLERYRWPGNIRELRNIVDRAVLLCSGGVITFKHLPVQSMLASSALPPPPGDGEAASPVDQEHRARVIQALEQSAWNQTRAARVLGVSRRTLITWLQKLDLPRPRK
jgi:transcriptional regulator with PAS, ATPase and Fis domain